MKLRIGCAVIGFMLLVVSMAGQTDVTTTGGKSGHLPLFNGTSTVIDSLVTQADGTVSLPSLTASGTISGSVVNANQTFNLAGTPFISAALNNVYVGFGTSTFGDNNTAIGFVALPDASNSAYNTAIGSNAGQLFNGASLNFNDTFLGAGSAASTVSKINNATAVGSNAEVSESNALVLGAITGVNGGTSVSVGIGTTAPTGTLDVVDNDSGGNTISVTTSASEASAVFASNAATSGSANGGFFDTHSPSGSAVVAINYGSDGSAAYFQGNVAVTGTLTKGGGSFKIDHPLDPANKYLSHSFVESPDMMNVYNGNVTTDKRGTATVVLPEYFGALNRDFRYQLTVIGQFAQAIVAKEISDNRFTIKTSKANVKVSWQVTGIRQDAFANAHRIPNEEEKPPQERGKYLHPELFGASEEQAVGYRSSPPSTATARAQVPAAASGTD